MSLFHWVQSLPSSLSISRLGIYVGKRRNTVGMFCSLQSLVSIKCFTVCQFWSTQQRWTLFDFRQCKILQHRLSMGHGIFFTSGKKKGTPSTGHRLPSKLRSEFLKCWLSVWAVITGLLLKVYIGKFRVRAYVHFHNILLDIFRGATVLFTTASCQGSLDLFAFGINSLKL